VDRSAIRSECTSIAKIHASPLILPRSLAQENHKVTARVCRGRCKVRLTDHGTIGRSDQLVDKLWRLLAAQQMLTHRRHRHF
jgi:hypothetical protein